MKIIIKVGDAQIEVEGQQLQVTKVASTGTTVEIKELKSKDEELQERLDRVADGVKDIINRHLRGELPPDEFGKIGEVLG